MCYLQEKLVNHRGGESSSLLVRVDADFKQLRLCLDIILDFGHALLKELLAMRRTVSWSDLHVHRGYIANAISIMLPLVCPLASTFPSA